MANTSTLSVSALLFSLEGRIPRSTYWLKYVVPYSVIHIILLLLDINAGTYDDRIGLGACQGSSHCSCCIHPSPSASRGATIEIDQGGFCWWGLFLCLICGYSSNSGS